MASTTPPEVDAEKTPDSTQGDLEPASLDSRQAEVAHIDALATAPETTLETFAHLDEKKILRKVRMHRNCAVSDYPGLFLTNSPDGPSADPHARPPLLALLPRP